MSLVITATHTVTGVGFDTAATAAAVRAGISCLQEYDDFSDSEGEPILAAELPIVEDVTDDEALETRMSALLHYVIQQLLQASFGEGLVQGINGYLLLALPSAERPGSLFYGRDDELTAFLQRELQPWFEPLKVRLIRNGAPAVIEGILLAQQVLAKDPNAVFIIGSCDSLLDEETLDWLEDNQRLMSGSFGRNHGLSPGEGAAFFILESEQGASSRSRQVYATVLGAGTAFELGAIVSDQPCRAKGLTDACRQALMETTSVNTVMGDLNGEFFRAKEWGLTEVRCLGASDEIRQLIHPADCYGDIGAASAGALINLANCYLEKGLSGPSILCFSSDDFGARGAVLLHKSNS